MKIDLLNRIKHNKQKYLFFFLIFVLSINLQSQNLVKNPSFEDTSLIIKPSNTFNTKYVPGTGLAPYWVTPTSSSSDFYNSNESTITGKSVVKAMHGEGRVGIIAGCADIPSRIGYKEYIMGRLVKPLQQDHYYKISFWVALDPTSNYAMDSIGMFITSRRIAESHMHTLSHRPQILQDPDHIITAKDGWVKISGLYFANGGEEYIIMGTFSRKSRIHLSTLGEKRPQNAFQSATHRFAYYYFDHVEVEEYDTTKGFDLNKEQVIIKPKAERFLFLVDVSQSMAAEGKLDSLKNALKNTFSSLPKTAEIALVTFSDQSKILLPFTKIEKSEFIINSIDSLTTCGNTLAAKSIEFVYRYLDQNKIIGKTSVFFFTDGVFELPPSSGALIKSKFASDNISFSAFQFGKTQNNDLVKITRQTAGSYITNSDQNLEQKLENELYTTEHTKTENPKIVRSNRKGGLVVLRYTLIAALVGLLGVKYL